MARRKSRDKLHERTKIVEDRVINDKEKRNQSSKVSLVSSPKKSKYLVPLTQQNILSFFIEKEKNKEDLTTTRKVLETTLAMSGSTIRTHLNNLIKTVRIQQTAEGSATRYRLIEPYACMHEKYFIYINQKLIGYLGFTEGIYQFAYTNAYLLSHSSTKVSTNLDLTTEIYYQAKLFPFFEALLPEGIDKKILEKKIGNPTHFYLFEGVDVDEYDIKMSKIRLDFKETKTENYLPYSKAKIKILGKEQPFPNLIPYPINIDEKKIFPSENLTQKEIKKLNIKPMSLSGFQHKFKIIIDEDKKEIRELNKDENALYFMKPYHQQKADRLNTHYLPHLAINEHLFMVFAKNELEFEVPYSGICKNTEDPEYHYFIQYFNRHKGYRYFMDEVSTIMGLDSETKYDTTAEKMFKEIEKVITSDVEKLKLLNFFFYSMVISHEDMHTKNLSIILDKEKYYASPLYDIATTKIYINSYGYDSHLSVNGKKNQIRLNDFFILVEILKLDKDIAKESFRKILQTFAFSLPLYIEKLKELGKIPFYKKTRETHSGNKSKTLKKEDLVDVLFHYHTTRVEELIALGYFHQLEIPAYNRKMKDSDIEGYKNKYKIEQISALFL